MDFTVGQSRKMTLSVFKLLRDLPKATKPFREIIVRKSRYRYFAQLFPPLDQCFPNLSRKSGPKSQKIKECKNLMCLVCIVYTVCNIICEPCYENL